MKGSCNALPNHRAGCARCCGIWRGCRFCLELFKPDLHQSFHLIGFGLCRCCGFLRFCFGVSFEPVTDFYPATSDERNALVAAEKYSICFNNVISFFLA
jgi:hypothetical protein